MHQKISEYEEDDGPTIVAKGYDTSITTPSGIEIENISGTGSLSVNGETVSRNTITTVEDDKWIRIRFDSTNNG